MKIEKKYSKKYLISLLNRAGRYVPREHSELKSKIDIIFGLRDIDYAKTKKYKKQKAY